MADRLDQDPQRRRERPVTYGLLALVGVAVVVGLVLGLGALGGARVLGVDGAEKTEGGDGQATMYLPKPEKTQAEDGPEVTLAPGEETAPNDGPAPSKTKTTKKPAKDISLSSGQATVSPMGQIDLTGVYPRGEGSILQVQRFEAGSWQDFPASPVSVSNETFSTFVQTGQPGLQRFRMLDTGTGETSNEVKVTVQ